MRRVTWVVAVVMCLALVLAGCGMGKKDAGSIVKDLDHVISKSGSYQASGSMILNTGQQPQEYQVEVAYSPDHFYRISLTNAGKDVTQIVLRNEEGVFVLTPHLKKSFRFQSDWPENQGQVYLFQSLAKSIIADKDRQFTTDNDTYVFDVAANYQNEQLSRQKIWLNKKTLAPKQVQVSDANKNVLVQVNFTSFEFDAKFDKDYFQMERNMTSWNLKSLPTMADVGVTDANHPATGGKSVTDKNLSATGGQSDQAAGQAQDGQKAAATKTGTDTTKPTAAASKAQSIGIIEPSYLPKEVVKQDITDMKLGEDAAVLLRYKGKYNFSLIEVRPQAKSVSLQPGTIVDLGFTIGVLTGDEKKTLTWTNDGVEFRLSTGDLPTNEMIKVAMATEGQSGK
ncbi:outer membrane lipoprotein-sorting protein [Paenibacillus sp. V4I3]|uniref:outer membrane lipoprotein-sorting protein n=1 Tax=unclassified Paenibacillus TaxID=185978 RepID=UPI002783BCE3|nr:MULTISPECIES: outer membrane lipoprotein-sorting protein [unclassified Paenibacillus]MDQ0873165.1 outer membrane lipoprotein-sorting protein [Paenibacillus sp. V4I3]MDQ0890919.1 outer membrane lipoprotein-sorting protein [Paenibacillus sp. V4I9]